MDEKILYYIWLSSIFHPGSKTPKFLLEHFGNIKSIYDAKNEDYKSLNLSSADMAILSNKNLDNAVKYYEYCAANNIGVLCYEDSYYPERLKIIDNPPPLLYYKGRLFMLDDYPCITMVGTRSCSERGFRFAYETAYDAASKGAVIVNGLALGIDGACIAGALDANGYAIGILGCGIDRIYPYGNKEIFDRLSCSGLILTEFAPFTKPEPGNFPVRNRVMSALSLATAVFEAGEGSGARLTAKHALDQGRRIFAVPSKPYDKSYSVALELIKDGATVFTESDDILTEYSMSFPHRINLANKNSVPNDKLNTLVAKYFKKDVNPDEPVNRRYSRTVTDSTPKNTEAVTFRQSKEKITNAVFESEQVNTKTSTAPISKNVSIDTSLSLLSEIEKSIYSVLCSSHSLTPDEIADRGFKIDEVLSTLTLLEIYGLVSALPGGKYQSLKNTSINE